MRRLALLGCVAVVLGVGVAVAVRPGDDPEAAPTVAAPLKGLKFVPPTELAKLGPVLAPREDARLPALFVDLFEGEELPRIYPWCQFTLEEGRPVWTWSTWTNSGVFETDGEALRKRLVARLEDRGFEALPGTPAKRPASHRTGERPMKYRRNDPGREIVVEFGGLMNWDGGRRSAVGIDLAVIVRGTQVIPTPTLDDVLTAFPDLEPPQLGEVRIPSETLAAIRNVEVHRVGLSGPGTTWYSLNVSATANAIKRAGFQETLAEQAEENGFEIEPPRENARGPREIVHYHRSGVKSSNARIRIHEQDDDGRRISLFVQR